MIPDYQNIQNIQFYTGILKRAHLQYSRETYTNITKKPVFSYTCTNIFGA